MGSKRATLTLWCGEMGTTMFSCEKSQKTLPSCQTPLTTLFHLRYSAIKDLHGNDKHNLPEGAVSHHLADELASNNITDVFCVGTAGDLCVSHTAMDVASAGFKAYVVEDVTKSFDAGKGWPAMKKELKAKGVEVVTLDGPEVGKVKALKGNGLGDDEKSGKQPAMTMVFKGNFNGPVFFGYAADQAKALMQTA